MLKKKAWGFESELENQSFNKRPSNFEIYLARMCLGDVSVLSTTHNPTVQHPKVSS